MTRARRRLVSFTLAALLTAPAAWGRPSQRKSPAPPPSPATSLFAMVSGWLGFGLPGSWFKDGSLIDPHGSCPANTTGDNGSIIDPHGSCAASATGDNGSIIDPNG